MQTMEVLYIRRQQAYESTNPGYTGYVTFKDDKNNEIKLNMSNEAAVQIVRMAALGIVQSAQEIAQLIVADAEQTLLPPPEKPAEKA